MSLESSPYCELSSIAATNGGLREIHLADQTIRVGAYEAIGETVPPFVQVSFFDGDVNSTDQAPTLSVVITPDNLGHVFGQGFERETVAEVISRRVHRALSAANNNANS